MLRALCLLIFLALSAQALFAKTTQLACHEVDLRNPALGPAVTQYSVGWCFGYAASDLLTNYYNARVSPVDTSIAYIEDLNQVSRFLRKVFQGDPTRGGFIGTAFKKAINKGICFEEDAIFKNTEDNVLAIHKAAKNNAIPETCKNRQRPAELRLETIVIGNNFEAARTMSDILNIILSQGRIVAIDYNTKVFTSEKSYQGKHASTIVAQRIGKDGRCEVLIRNSWETSCDEYSYTRECEAGHLWVARQDLQKHLNSMSYILNENEDSLVRR